jgi:hypothetical protein
MYHDTEVDKYWYRYFEDKLPKMFPDGFRRLSYRPMVHHDSSAPIGRAIVRQEPCTDIIFKPEHEKYINDFVLALKKNHEEYYWPGAAMELMAYPQ